MRHERVHIIKKNKKIKKIDQVLSANYDEINRDSV